MIVKIGVISDTHGVLRPQALECIKNSDLIIHAGDIGAPEVICQLEKIAPVRAIRGNVDRGEWALNFSTTDKIDFHGKSIYVIHNIRELDFNPANEAIDVVVYGHSHQPGYSTVDGVLMFNPGSAGPRRFTLPVCVGMMTLQDNRLESEIIELDV